MKKIILALLFSAFSFQAQATLVNGNDWLDFSSFTNTTYDQVNAAFSNVTGQCKTASCIINGVDVTDYTWASSNDINSLLVNYGASSVFDSTTSVTLSPISNAFFSSFSQTNSNGDIAILSSDIPNINSIDYFVLRPAGTDQFVNLGARKYKSYSGIGHGFFRATQIGSIPEPATFALFALGLVGLGFSRRAIK